MHNGREREKMGERGEAPSTPSAPSLSLSQCMCVALTALRTTTTTTLPAATGNGKQQRRIAPPPNLYWSQPPVRDVADRCVLASCGVTGVSRAFNYTCTCTRTRASNTHGSAILREGVAEDVECRAL